MLTEYLTAAMRKAHYELLPDNEGFYGEIPGFQGVYSNAPTLEECRDVLAEVLEGWMFLHISQHLPLPVVDNLTIETSHAAMEAA